MAERGAEDLRAAIEDKEAEILKAIQKMTEERQQTKSEAPLKFKLSLGITADLDASEVETVVSYSVRTTVRCNHEIANEDETPGLFD
jgi:hypothetical protein